MNTLAFWKTWHPVYQRVFWIYTVFLFFGLAFLWYSNFTSPEPVFSQEHLQQLEPLPTDVHSFEKGITPHTVRADSYVIFERVVGSALNPNVTAAYVYLTLLVAGLILVLTVLTTLTRFWFYIGIGIFLISLGSLRIDNLGWPINGKIVLGAVMASYLLSAYYFVFIRPSISFIQRLLIFLAITIALAGVIFFFAGVAQPLYFLSTNGLVVGTVLTIIFTFTVAHEIVAAFVSVVTRTAKPTRSLQHFLVITAVYLVNLWLLYANRKHIIEWNLFPFSLFLLITISGLLGVWGFRQRSAQYESFIKVNPYGVYFFIAFAGICFGSLGYVLATVNDPMIRLMEDAIIYSHLGYGLIFLVYLIANFFSMLGSNLQVYKVLYQPMTMPYFTFRIAGLIATFAFFAYSNWQVSVHQAYAGYNNAMGDYFISKDTARAEEFFRLATFYANRNYHGHYAIAEIDGLRNDEKEQIKEYHLLADTRPLDLAYLNLAQLYEGDHLPKKAQEVLKMGLKDFPGNGLLQDALSLLSDKLVLPDSALFLAKEARKFPASKNEAETNLVGLSAKYAVRFPADSLERILNSENPGVKTNLLTLASQQGKKINYQLPTDTVWSVYDAASINNFLLNRLSQGDTAATSHVIEVAKKTSNEYFKEYILPTAAQSYYASGLISKAFNLIREDAFAAQDGDAYKTLGLWALERGSPQTATNFLEEGNRLRSNTLYEHASALTESGDFATAAIEWDSLLRSNQTAFHEHARKMQRVLNASLKDAIALTDEEKYEFSRHRFSLLQNNEFTSFVGTISNPGIKTRAIIDRSRKLDEADELTEAIATLNLLKSIGVPEKTFYNEALHLHLRFLARQGQWEELARVMTADLQFDGEYIFDKYYFNALLEQQRPTNTGDEKQFLFMLNVNPFFEDAVIAGLTYLNQKEENRLKNYSLLVYAMDLNPYSVKLLKTYVLQSAALGFTDSAQTTMDKLKSMIPAASFEKFIRDNPDVFRVKGN